MNLNFLKRIVKYFTITFFIILLYVHISRLWVNVGGGVYHFLKIESILVFFIFAFLYFDKIKNSGFKHLLPTLPPIIIYISFDIFYNYLERSPRPSDLQNFPALFEFSPIMGIGGILMIFCILLPLAFLVYLATKEYSIENLITIVFIKIFTIGLIIFFLATDTFNTLHLKIYKYDESSHRNTILINGRINSFIYYYGKEKENRKNLLHHRSNNINISDALYPGKPIRTPNIHLIVLESFIDPRMLKDLQFNRSPLADDLQQFIKDQEFSYVIAPTYGGGTAQAEFELLTGIKAFGKVESAEFNVMNGREVNGFVKNLKDNGYQVLASIASGSEFYNSTQAYKSLGFDEPHFLENRNIKKRGDKWIFDGDLLDYNIQEIRTLIKNSDKPIFNYILGMYGHIPFNRNTHLRPDTIYTTHQNIGVLRLSNQFYYRTKAIAKYIKTLNVIDPSGIIYVTSDHLPPILGDDIHYIKDKHINISLLINSGKYIDVSGKNYYEIPWLVWDILTGKENNRILKEGMEALYYTILAESL